MAITRILILGDSHSRSFGIAPLLDLRPALREIDLDLDMVAGATLSALESPSAGTSLGERLLRTVESTTPHIVGIALGQVDIEVGYYDERFVKGQAIEFDQFVSDILGRLERFLGNLRGRHHGGVFVKGVNVSGSCHDRLLALRQTTRVLIKDVQAADKRKQIVFRIGRNFPSDEVRASHLRSFNDGLRALCERHDVFYFDINDAIVDTKTGAVEAAFVDGRLGQHIVDSVRTRLLYWDPLLAHLSRLRPLSITEPGPLESPVPADAV